MSYVSKHAEQNFVEGRGPDPWSREPVSLRESMAMYDAILRAEAKGRKAFSLWWQQQHEEWLARKADAGPDIPWEEDL